MKLKPEIDSKEQLEFSSLFSLRDDLSHLSSSLSEHSSQRLGIIRKEKTEEEFGAISGKVLAKLLIWVSHSVFGALVIH